MNSYEEKQEARRERLARKAEQAAEESKSRFESATRRGRAMGGQPILIGHHSEKGHRADIKRMDNDMRKGSEAHSAAKKYEQQAEAVGKGGISGDDPEALTKLRTRLAKLENDRDQAKAINAYWRKHGTLAGFDGLNEEGAARIDTKMKAQQEPDASWMPDKHKVFPGYFFTNVGGNIKRIKGRIISMEANAQRKPTGAVQGANWLIEEDRDENRMVVMFDEKPGRDVCTMLRQHGFNWSPSRVAWVRQLTDNARLAALRVQQILEGE